MASAIPTTTYLHGYTPPDYLVDTVELRFYLGEETTTVKTRMAISRNPARDRESRPLVLFGQDLKLEFIAIDGQLLHPERYSVDAEQLVVHETPKRFVLDVATQIRPKDNTSLEGLYKSASIFCTQCEAEGFRKITYFPDRPDCLARYTTTIVADKDRCPVMLSNGNLMNQGELNDNRHWVTWEDPYRKPSYLFALVAGDLAHIEDTYATRSGREVRLRIYVERHNIQKCDHAMQSLKRAMAWDEETFGLEYDLDTYMIVAVDDFNMGAMENKGLNVFNSKYVLANPETATDGDYGAIESVIAHEYFHNWTGNRVTCRDWFQLSLKEGLTVFRDQEYSADIMSRPVQRINDVRTLRTGQFTEDAGPMAHPVRPSSYIEINNFYTMTVYQKGAEVVRMIHTLLGADGFRRGMDLYFERHDGQAVTTDDFVQAMEDANGADLMQFRRWYSQAGTPVVEASGRYDEADNTYELTLSQSCPPTPGQPHKEDFQIPIAMGLLDADGRDMPLRLEGENAPSDGPSRVVNLKSAHQRFRFVDVSESPTPSLLRGFSAPVKLRMERDDEQLAFLIANDTDPFNRWDAAQELATQLILRLVAQHRAGAELEVDTVFVDACRRTLENADADPALAAQILSLPSELYVAERMDIIDVDGIHTVRERVKRTLATALENQWREVRETNTGDDAYRFDALSAGQRSLKNLCLDYLMALDDHQVHELCAAQFSAADNMTDALSALHALANCECAQRVPALEAFYDRWSKDTLVLDKWFVIQATSQLQGTLSEVENLTRHPAFIIKNPNKVRSLIGAFCHHNQVRFHDESGAGYRFLADRVLEIDPMNPQIAARLLGAMSRWRRFGAERQELMKLQLERIVEAPKLSRDTYEVASKTLQGT